VEASLSPIINIAKNISQRKLFDYVTAASFFCRLFSQIRDKKEKQ